MSSGGPGSDRKEKTFTGSSNASMRTNLNDKLAKLHVKHQAEIDFLEDMRSFSKQRSAIEREYSQGLQRLVQQFLAKRDIKDPPHISSMDRSDNRGLMEVWKMLLQKTEEAAKARMNVSEMLLSHVSEEMRQLKRVKEQTFKRLAEMSQKMNSEILDSVKELVTCKKTYGDLEKVCSDARQKFTEAETRIRKGDRRLFESTQSLEKTYNKTAERLKQCQKKTTVARNEYILAIATTNAHLNKHGGDDLPSLMKAMDGDMYEKSRDIYMLYAQIEADAAILAKAQFEDLREQSYLVNRDYVVKCFFHKNPVLKDRVEYRFAPHDKDTVCCISRDHGAEIFLEKDARKWASRLVKHQNSVTTLEKQIKGLRSVTSAYTKNPEFGTSEAFSEAQQKISESEESIREVQVKIVKSEARLSTLREVGIDVSRHMEKAQEKHRGERPSSEAVSTGDRPASTLLTVTQDLGASEEWLETSSMSSRSGFEDGLSIGSVRSDTSPKHCIALYDYTAQRPDELSITTDEELEVLEWDDGDGWSKGRNQRGQEGYFPQTYVRAVSPSSSPRSSSTVQQVQQLMNSDLSGPLQELGSERLHDDEVESSELMSNGGVNIINHNSLLSPSKPVTMLRAVYEYTAEDEEELTFPEGAELELVHKDDELQDGFWRGRYQGREGLFPAVVVEIITNGTCSTPILDSTLISGSSPSSIGPSPTAIFPDATPTHPTHITSSSSSARLHPTSFNYNLTPAPKVRVQPETPAEGDLERTWRMDSFEDYDDDEEISEV